MSLRRALPLLAVVAAGLAPACADPDTEVIGPEDPRSGGATTVFDLTRDAFARPLANLKGERRDPFFLGNSTFNRPWIQAPASVADFDGLGPLFNATNCSACHFKDGRGRPPDDPDGSFDSILLRLSVPGVGPHGGPNPDPVYGDQLQDRGILGVVPEGRPHVAYAEVPGTYADGAPYSLRRPTYTIDALAYGPLDPAIMLSARTAPAIFGLGLIAAVPEQTIEALADPFDRDGDGVRGRPNHVWDARAQKMVLGRFGWKANQPTLEQQNAGAFVGDIGITSSLFPDETCSAAMKECLAAATGPRPQVKPLLLEQVDFYTHTLAPPGRRDLDTEPVVRGRRLFAGAGCATCHLPTLITGVDPAFPEVSNQTIHPFTDLLLHDMGPDLADGRPDFEASGSEWRTAPLWGIGLVPRVNRHELFLHDGRARGFAEAILWHGGEAGRARDAFRGMPKADRAALEAYLRSL